MTKIIADRVLETSTTTGTGAYTLAGAVTGYQSASICANGDTFDYFAESIDANGIPNGGWETGLGTWNTGGTLTRTVIYTSSNSNAAVSWGAGTKRIAMGLTAKALNELIAANSTTAAMVQDLSSVDTQALHRSPNAVTSLFVYDTSKDSDGGAWIEKQKDKSWYSEALSGAWLGPRLTEIDARGVGATVGAELLPDPGFNNPSAWAAVGAGWSVVNGKGVATAAADNTGYTTGAVIAGKTYRYSITCDSISSGGFKLMQPGGVAPTGVQYIAGTYTGVLTATASGAIYLVCVGVTTAQFDNMSVKEVSAFNTNSNDYYQYPTDGKFYRLWKNFISASDVPFSDGRTITATRAGTNLYTATGSGSQVAYSSMAAAGGNSLVFPVTNGQQYTVSFVAEQGTYTSTISVQLRDNVGTQISNLVTGVAIPVSGAGGARQSVTLTASATSAQGQIFIMGVTTGQTILVGAVQIEMAPMATAYEAKATGVGSISEVFRGNTAKFPRLAAIVVEGFHAVIYDLTAPGRPMWMSFYAVGSAWTSTSMLWCPASSLGSVSMLNGILSVTVPSATLIGLATINFAKDNCIVRCSNQAYGGLYSGNIAARNSLTGYYVTNQNHGYGTIQSSDVKSVSMTVLPNAPMDAATGLLVPTIAVGTAAGISIVENTGSITAITCNGNSITSVYFDGSTLMLNLSNNYYVCALPYPWAASTTYPPTGSRSYNGASVPAMLTAVAKVVTKAACGDAAGITRFKENPATVASGLVSYITGTYNTGWMTGDIRRCLLSSLGAGTVTATGLITGDNSTFASGTGTWSAAFQSTIAAVAGQLVVTATGTNPYAALNVTVTPFTEYKLTFDVIAKDAGVTSFNIRVGNIAGTGHSELYPQAVNFAAGNGQSITFSSDATGVAYIQFVAGCTIGNTFTLDNITLVPTVSDKSVKLKPSTIYGTLTKTAVATSAQLVGYSGWSATPEVVGNELITNGTFDTDLSGWTVGSGITWSAGTAALGAGSAFMEQGFTTVAGTIYKVTGTVVGPSAFMGVWDGAGQASILGTSHVRTGSFSFLFRANDTTSYFAVAAGGGGASTIDSISVKSAVYTDELITNGDFTTTTTEWIAGNGATLSVDTNRLKVLGTGTGNPKATSSDFPTVIGRTYLVTCDVTLGTNTIAYMRASTNGGVSLIEVNRNSNGQLVLTFTATTTLSNVLVYIDGTTLYGYFDNISCKAISPFGSGSNVAQEAYSADLDFGTAAWSLSAWVNIPTNLTTTPATYLSNFPKVTNTELFTNGDFSGGSTGWSINGNWSVGSGIASSTVGASTLFQTVLTVGKWYLLTWTSADAVNINAVFGTTFVSGQYVGANGYAFGQCATNGVCGLQGGGPYSGIDNMSVKEVSPAMIIDRSAISSASIKLGTAPDGKLTAIVYDGTTTRTVTSTVAYNNASWTKVRVNYTTDGSLTLHVNGVQAAQTTGSALLTLNSTNAVLTVGNARTLDAPFPGSIALLKLGVTVPTTEQSAFMYIQEKQMFNAGANIILPTYSTNGVLDLTYDEAMDSLIAVQANNETRWTGLVRHTNNVPNGGAFNKGDARSGVRLFAHNSSNIGVDVSMPSISLREELVNRAERAAALSKTLTVFDFDAITAQTDFVLPAGWTATEVLSAGARKREGATKDWIRVFDGFREIIRFAVAPGNTVWVSITARRDI